MKNMSAKKMKLIAWSVFGLFFVAGIALGFIFETPDNNLNGEPIMVFDFGLMFCVWLAGALGGLFFIGKAMNRK